MNLEFLKGKKILVTGGAGLLGMNLTQFFVKNDLEVKSTYFTRPPLDHLKNFYQQFDLSEYEACLDATKGQDIVIIGAIQAYGVQGMKQSATSSVLSNLKIQAGLLEACSVNNVKKVVWISSSTVYQEAFYPITEDQLDLNQPPYELYQGLAWVYRYIEQLAQCYTQKQNLPVGIIRTSSIFGPFDRFDDDKSHVIPGLIKRALKKENPFIVWGNGFTVRDFVYVDDLVKAIVMVLEGYCNATPINFSNGTAVNIKTLVEIVLNICDHSAEPIYDETKPSATPYRVLDNTKFDTVLGKVERTDLNVGIKKTVDWYRSNKSYI
jgi:GDP-L-fucose synthase